MDYSRHYNLLIDRARNRLPEDGVYYEKHHIVPRSIGGSDYYYNCILLTPEEHLVAHLLLVKIHPSEGSLVRAAHMMLNRSNKIFGWLRRRHAILESERRTGSTLTETHKRKIGKSVSGHKNGMFGKKHSDETRERMRQSNKSRDPAVRLQIGQSRRGKLHTEETKNKMKLGHYYRWVIDPLVYLDEQRRRASNPKKEKDGYSKPKSAEHAASISHAALQRPRVVCDICGRLITKANFDRHRKSHITL
jgi:NUMOD3 motif